MTMYDIYNAQTLDNLINTLERKHNKSTWNEKSYLWVNIHMGLIGIYQRKEQCIMQ